MNKVKTIFKDWYLMDAEEQEVFRQGLLENYLDDNEFEDIENYDEDAFEEYCIDTNSIYFEDDFGEHGNVSYSPLANQEVVVIGNLGLWNGNHKIIPHKYKNVNLAIRSCLQDENHIYEDRYGNLHIEAHHHDGTNHFIIKKLVNGKMRCLHFMKEVFGC
ncbi:MAG: hypothetical protein LIR50_19225 [Bacillota bacterium]|nr:hypothetical protein [Bacillota bacterium]